PCRHLRRSRPRGSAPGREPAWRHAAIPPSRSPFVLKRTLVGVRQAVYMRFIIYGAGAVGGVIGGRLFQAGQDVTLIARGEHLRALQDRGLTLAAPAETVTLAVPAVATP